MQRRSKVRWLLLPVFLASACSESRDPTPSAPSADLPEFQAAPLDPDIDENDTYVAFDAEVTTKTTLTFATPTVISGQQVTQLTLPQPVDNTFTVEAGYDEQGMVRVHQRGSWSTTIDSTKTVIPDAHHSAIVKGKLQTYSPSGVLLAAGTPPETAPPASTLVTRFGNALLYGNISAGVLVDSLTAAGASVRLSGNGLQASLVAKGVAGGPSKAERKYRKENGRWVLDEVSIEQEATSGKTKVHSSTVMKLRRLKYQVNPERDAERARRLAGEPASAVGIPAPALLSFAAAGPPDLSVASATDHPIANLYSCEYYNNCDDEDPPAPPPPPPPGRNVAWQHGFASGAGVWNQMRTWVGPLYRWNRILAPDLSEYARAETQSTELINQLVATGQKSYLVIGHSMGGLVARRAAQRRPDLITGVLTLGTPHQGAALTATGSAALRDVLTAKAIGMSDCSSVGVYDHGCYIADVLIRSAIGALVEWGRNSVAPATEDLLPIAQNPFLTSLSLPSETFVRAGIKNTTSKSGMVVRLMGDRICGPYSSGCGGRAWAKYWNAVHNAARVCQIFAALGGDIVWFIRCTKILSVQNDIDGFWNHLVAPGENRSDGIVQYSSQAYPGAPINYDVPGGDSHIGEPQSDKVRPRIQDAFNLHFRVPRP